MAIIKLQDLSISFGSPLLLDNVNLQLHEGQKISLLGRNGVGKSTLMKIINGDIEPDSGSIIRAQQCITSFLPQEVPNDITGSVYSIIAQGAVPTGKIVEHLDNYEEQKYRQQIDKTLSLISLNPDNEFTNLSAGMKRRVLLGRALASDPDILLLDEPTNHLDIASIEWLEDFIAKHTKTIFFVTHDRAFLEKIATRIIELDRGKIFDWDCDYQTFLKRKENMLEAEESQNALFDKKLAQEEIWIRKGIKARRTRNEGRVRVLKKMREESANRRNQIGNVNMEIQLIEKSGKLAIEAEDISFAYDNKSIIKNFSTIIARGDKIGIIGPNGCGKTTLIKLLLEELKPQNGKVRLGTRIDKIYFDQLRGQLDEEKTVIENVTDGNEIIDLNGRSIHVIGYLQDFLFLPERAKSPVKNLSGGEKNRLLLAKLFTRPANFIILDEPTNDLDIETVELLEELLLTFKGTLLLVSHDRSFLNNVVTNTLVFEEDAVVKQYAGGYDDWLIQRKNSTPKKSEKKVRQKKTQDKKKLTFKEKKELESLPEIVEQKEKRKDELFSLMSDPSFYQQKGDEVSVIKDELQKLETELEHLYLRWEELDEKNPD